MILFIQLLIMFFIGYAVGRYDKPEQTISQAITTIQKAIIKKEIPTGQIKPKTPEQIALRQMDPKKREGLEAMKETLDKLI